MRSPLCDVQLLSLQCQLAQCLPHSFRLWRHLQRLQECDGPANTHFTGLAGLCSSAARHQQGCRAAGNPAACERAGDGMLQTHHVNVDNRKYVDISRSYERTAATQWRAPLYEGCGFCWIKNEWWLTADDDTFSSSLFSQRGRKMSVSVKGSAAARPHSGVTCGLSFLNVFKSQQSEEITE